jgi:hypothetical protein
VPEDVGLDLQRLGGHRQHSPAGIEQATHEVEPLDSVSQLVPDRDDEQIAQGVACERPFASEPVLQDVPPGAPPRAVLTQRREGHPQVTRREHVELGP